MKKVKIMLAAVAVFAVVGGALAFKAKIEKGFYCTNAANKSCTTSVLSFSTFDANAQQKPYFCSTESHTGNDCPAVSLIDAD
jgi:hypothetical protein